MCEPVDLRDELVGEAAARRDRFLRDVRDAVHRVRQALPVEVDAGRLGHVVREDRADLVALGHVDARARPGPVEPERVERLRLRVDLVLDGIDGQLEDLGVAVHRRREWLVALARQRRALAAQEPVDRRLRVGVMVDDRC